MLFTFQISVLKAQLQEVAGKVKDLQRESYFVGLERKRKTGVITQLRDEIEESKRREALKKMIETKIRKEVCVGLLCCRAYRDEFNIMCMFVYCRGCWRRCRPLTAA